jgi:hypothetical protein
VYVSNAYVRVCCVLVVCVCAGCVCVCVYVCVCVCVRVCVCVQAELKAVYRRLYVLTQERNAIKGRPRVYDVCTDVTMHACIRKISILSVLSLSVLSFLCVRV